MTRPPAWRSGAWAGARTAASAQAARLAAALESRSTIRPQLLHRNVRSASLIRFSVVPQCEVVAVEGAKHLFVGYTESDWNDVGVQYGHAVHALGLRRARHRFAGGRSPGRGLGYRSSQTSCMRA